MSVYIVTYDLCKESSSEKYSQLVSLIKEEGIWAFLGGSSYLIETNLSPVDLRDKYSRILNNDDKLYVGMVSAPAAWWGYAQEVSDWIKAKL